MNMNNKQQTEEIEVHPVRNVEDLYNVYELERTEYGKQGIVSFSKLAKWWQCFRDGAYVLKIKGIVKGGMGLWPLQKESFKRIKYGMLLEPGLVCNDLICGVFKDNKIRQYWYFGDIIISPELRRDRSNYGHQLGWGGLKQWIQSPTLPDKISICAVPYTEDARKRMKFYGATSCCLTRNGEVFILVTSKTEIQNRLNSLSPNE